MERKDTGPACVIPQWAFKSADKPYYYQRMPIISIPKLWVHSIAFSWSLTLAVKMIAQSILFWYFLLNQ